MSAGCLLIDEQKPGYLGKTFALISKQYDFHAVPNFSITLHPVG
jgi:hypothetical protein